MKYKLFLQVENKRIFEKNKRVKLSLVNMIHDDLHIVIHQTKIFVFIRNDDDNLI